MLITLTLPAWGIERIALRRKWKSAWRYLFYLPNLLIAIGLVALAANESYSASADYWKGTLLTLTLCLTIPECITAILLLPVLLLRKHAPKATRFMSCAALGLGAVFFCIMLYGFTLGYRQITTQEVTFASHRIPSNFDGFRIVQISDLHLGTLHGRGNVVEQMVKAVNACQPDLVVFTGDLVNYRSSELFEFEEELKKISARHGVISVMGNHDYAQYFRHASSADSLADIRLLQQHQREMGWNLLLNENVTLHSGNDSIAIIGVENNGRKPFPALANLEKAQQGLKEDCFKILLSHDPTHWRSNVLPETNIDLTLSGHTHGMQFKIGSLSPASWFYDEWGGIYQEPDGRTLHVSLGTGSVMMPFRLGAWPEINLITLKRDSINHKEQ